jgi:glucokinase
MSSAIKSKVIGIDIGYTTTTIAVVDIRGTILALDSFHTSNYPQINSFVEQICERLVKLAEANGGYENIRSVGVTAANANYKTGCIENAVNMPWKGEIPLALMLRDRLGLAVAVGNDAHGTAMGEFAFGSAHGMSNFIIISLGHGGIGSCFFSNGTPHLGHHGFAGEVGHTCVVKNGRQCTCGRKGCLEEYAAERGIIQTAREVMEESNEPSLMRSLTELTSMTIGECCDQNDKLAWEVFRRTGYLLGIGLANYATVINPEAIILTGEQTQIYKWLEPSLVESFEQHVFHNMRDKVKIVVSTLDNNERDVLGASALAWTVKEYSLFL